MKKHISSILLGGLTFGLVGCATVSPDAVALQVDVPWTTMSKCSAASPEMKIGQLPSETKFIQVVLSDKNVPTWSHGGGKVAYTGSNIIDEGALKGGYNGPCPPSGSHMYNFSVNAIDKDGVIIGQGNAVSQFPVN